ncbi:MAG: hypothetical protein WC703_07880 [Candidatus Neomarinimicrobiota bacterium]
MTAWGLTVLGAAAMGDATWATTIIPIIGPYLSIKIVEENEEYTFQPGGKILLKAAGDIQALFGVYFLFAGIGNLLWEPPKNVSVFPTKDFSGLCINYSF